MNIADFRKTLEKATQAALAEIAAGRAALDAKRAELKALERGLLPLAEAKANIAPLVAAEGARWKAEWGNHLLRIPESLNRKARGLAEATDRGEPRLLTAATADAWGLICFTDPGRAEAMLATGLEKMGYEPGLPLRDRPAAIERVSREVADLEAADERRIDEARAADLKVEHRADVKRRKQDEAQRAEREARLAADLRARQDAVDEAAAREVPRGFRASREVLIGG